MKEYIGKERALQLLEENASDDEVFFAARAIEAEPAVPHEMSAREYAIARRRLCNAHLNAVNQCVDDFVTRCAGCLIEDYCEGAKDDVDEEIAIVEKWAREHPEERSEEDA